MKWCYATDQTVVDTLPTLTYHTYT